MQKEAPIDRLLEKIHREQLAYHKRLLSSSKEEIWAAAEEISLHNAICWLLETEDLTDQEINTLFQMDHPLEKICEACRQNEEFDFHKSLFHVIKTYAKLS